MSSVQREPTSVATSRPTRRSGATLTYDMVRAIVLLLFLLSGASALIYEVAWVRLLSLAFGVSVYAVSAVLTAFMGGLALGSWGFGRVVSQAERTPQEVVRLYALLQAGVGLFALLTPFLYTQLTSLYVTIDQIGLFNRTATAGVRFGLAFLVLLLPTALMGGTLPVMSQLLARRDDTRGEVIGALYAANTCGAVLGTVAAGLVLIRFFGVSATIWIAAAIDLLVAGMALWLWRQPLRLQTSVPRAAQQTAETNAASAGTTGRKKDRQRAKKTVVESPVVSAIGLSQRQMLVALVGFALSGFASLGYQVVWTRLLVIFSINAVFSFSVMLATFLIGLALGGALMSRYIDRTRDPLKVFGFLELAIGVCSVLVLYIFAKLPTLIERFTLADTYGGAIRAEWFAAGVTMLVPTLLIGATFPAAARAYGGEGDDVGNRIGRLYAFNTLGAMAGSLLAGFALIPLLGLQWAALSLAALNLAVGAAALLAGERRARSTWAALGGALAVAGIAAALLPPGIYLGFREGATDQLKFYREGIDATVAVFEVENPPLKVSFVNGRNEVPTDVQSMRAFYVLGHLPPLLRPDARNALMISFGNGIASGAMSRHPLEHIQAVELVVEQLQAARLFTAENRDVLNNPRVGVTVEDGRNYLLRSGERYDIITADATHPINASSWALFTSEFYTLVSQHLNEKGVFVQWLPFHDLSADDYRSIVKTFNSVFPHTTLFYTGGVHTFLVATPEPLTREQVAAFDGQIKALGIGDDLGDAAKLASDLLLDERGVAAYAATARVVHDDDAFFIPRKNEDEILQSFAPYALK